MAATIALATKRRASSSKGLKVWAVAAPDRSLSCHGLVQGGSDEEPEAVSCFGWGSLLSSLSLRRTMEPGTCWCLGRHVCATFCWKCSSRQGARGSALPCRSELEVAAAAVGLHAAEATSGVVVTNPAVGGMVASKGRVGTCISSTSCVPTGRA